MLNSLNSVNNSTSSTVIFILNIILQIDATTGLCAVLPTGALFATSSY